MDRLSNTLIEGFTSSYRDFARRVHDMSAQLSEEQFWTRPYAYGNSFGHLTLHLIGNLNYYIGTQIAHTGYVRERDREFNEPTPPSKQEVLSRLDETVRLVVSTLENETAESWSEPYDAAGAGATMKDRFSAYLGCAAHFHHHVGQMIYLTKAFNEQITKRASSNA
jgi:Protein of unknown function (DUF1572)